jgi:hypothetical protein
MKKYIVAVKEVHSQFISVEAENEEDAVRVVLKGEGDYDDGTEFVETLPKETWIISEG